MFNFRNIKKVDIDIYDSLKREIKRQKETLELIPSENITSKAVMACCGSILTNKYSEGYPNKRYYGGNKYIDEIEQRAIDLACKLFNQEAANVQPHSGSNANFAVYSAFLNAGDTVLGMDLTHGGHLTHGHPVSQSGKLFNFIRYKTKEDGQIDYDELFALAREHRPKIIIAGFSSYTRDVDWDAFSKIAKEVGAISMADISHIAGLIAGGVVKGPKDFDVITTTTHKTLRGPRGGLILCKEKYIKEINKAVFPGTQGGPLEHIIAAKGICFKEALEPKFKKYARDVVDNAKEMERGLTERGIKICFNGTDNHMLLLDLSKEKIDGKEAEKILDDIGICCNANAIPNEKASMLKPSGLRIGTPSITTRGFNKKDSYKLGSIIADVIKAKDLKKSEKIAREFVRKMVKKYKV